jgi:fibronectin-binding autotransporter adhesin
VTDNTRGGTTIPGKTIKFSGNGKPGDLLDPKNWIGGVVPGVTDTALIQENIGGPVTGTFSVNNMMLLGTETITFDGTLDTTGVGACQGLMVCDGAEAIFAPSAVLNDGNVLIVGNDAVGTLMAMGSGTTHSVLHTVDANIGKQDAGVGTVTINDAVWDNSGHAFLGDDGTATLNVVNNGSVVFGGGVDMAADTGSSGTMTIASGGSVAVGGWLDIGSAATADVSVAGNSHLSVHGGLTVGATSELGLSAGTVQAGVTQGRFDVLAGGVISGHGVLAAPDGVAVEDDGIIRATGGTLEIDGNINGTGTLQIAADSVANLTGSSLKLAGIAFIGPDATLELTHGATVTAAISGFSLGDILQTTNVDAASFSAPTGILTLSEHGVKVETLHLLGRFAGDTFTVQQTAAGALITFHH